MRLTDVFNKINDNYECNKDLDMSNKWKYSVVLLFALTIGTMITTKISAEPKMIGMLDFEDLDINDDGKVSKDEIRSKDRCSLSLWI